MTVEALFQNITSNSSNWTFSTQASADTGAFLASAGIFTVLIIVINSFLILLIATDSHLRQQVFYKCILNICACALLFGVIVLPFGMTTLVENHWIHGKTMCKFWTAMDYLSFAILSLSTIGVMINRLLAKLKPEIINGPRSSLMALGFIFVPWAIPLIVGLPIILQSIIHFSSRDRTFCMVVFKDELQDTHMAVLHVTPMVLLICITIGLSIHEGKDNFPCRDMGITKAGNGSTDMAKDDELRASLVASCAVGWIFSVLWLPFIIVTAINWLCKMPKCTIIPTYNTQVGLYMTSASSCIIHAVVWIVTLPELRLVVKVFFSGMANKIRLPKVPVFIRSTKDSLDTSRLYKATYEP